MGVAPPLLDRRLLFVTGKGGVGKTTIAAALGLLAAREGKRTLVCEVDAKGNLADSYECGPLAFDEREVQPGLFAMAMETEASLREYLSLNLKLPLLTRIGPLASIFDYVAAAAPGVREVLTVGKLCWEVRERNYDLVVVDGPATGHVVGHLAAPAGIRELVSVGLIRNQTQWMLDLLDDPAVTGVVVTALPEEMPVTESLELIERLDHETGVDLAQVVVNRVLPELFGRTEEEVFDRLREPWNTMRLGELVGSPVGPLLDAAEFATSLRRSRVEHIGRLRDELAGRVPMLYVPELFSRTHGLRSTRRVADALEAELL
ncbi:MAG: ArsA family ATPase [Actinomycetota bacterium]